MIRISIPPTFLEIAYKLGLRDTRTKELLKELVAIDKLVDNGKAKGKMYRIK